MLVHYKILKPLLVSSLIISFLVSVSALYLELEQTEERISLLAKNEVRSFIDKIKTLKTLQKNTLLLKDTNFQTISIFNANNKNILSQETKIYPTLIKELKLIDYHLKTRSKINLEERLIRHQQKNTFYFQFDIPITLYDFKGSIRGLYKISDSDIQKIYLGIFYSILQLVFAVLITSLFLYPLIIHLNKTYIQQSKNLLEANLEIMSVLGSLVATRDNETNSHNYRVTLYAIAFAKSLGLSNKAIIGLIKGAFLHDIGKICISDSILLKSAKLNDLEFEQMKYHVGFGLDIISKSKWLREAKDVIAYHHEQYDGNGYNKNIVGEQIPINARIFMICDVFDTLSSKRPYEERFDFESSINIIKEKSGSHFDPNLVPVFCDFIETIYIKISHLEDEDTLHIMLNKKLHHFLS